MSVGPIDRAGFALSTSSMALLVYTIIEAPGYDWGSARSVAGFAIGLGLLTVFVVWERRASDPMLDVGLFRNPRFAAACAAVTVSFFTLLGFIFVMTQYFQFIKRYDALSAGVHLLPVAASVGISSVLGTKLAVRFGTKLVVASGLVMVTVFYVWVAAIVAPGNAYGLIAIQMVLYGTGMGLTSAPATEAIMGVVPREKGRCRIGRQRHDEAARRHIGCGRDRQRLRLDLRQSPDDEAAPSSPPCARVGRALLGGRRPRRRRTPDRGRADGPRRSR
jgi:hypothetical protein